MNYKVTVPPTTEPITRDEAKIHLRVDGTAEDTYIDGLIIAARQMVEQYLNRALITQTIEQRQANFDGGIRVFRNPIISITSIKHQDTDNVEATILAANYSLKNGTEPATIDPAYGKTWPTTTGEKDNVVITYTAGYGAATDVPQLIKQAMLLIIGDLYENRQDAKRTMPQASECLLNPYRLNIF